jgi:hypothetical protein
VIKTSRGGAKGRGKELLMARKIFKEYSVEAAAATPR